MRSPPPRGARHILPGQPPLNASRRIPRRLRCDQASSGRAAVAARSARAVIGSAAEIRLPASICTTPPWRRCRRARHGARTLRCAPATGHRPAQYWFGIAEDGVVQAETSTTWRSRSLQPRMITTPCRGGLLTKAPGVRAGIHDGLQRACDLLARDHGGRDRHSKVTPVGGGRDLDVRRRCRAAAPGHRSGGGEWPMTARECPPLFQIPDGRAWTDTRAGLGFFRCVPESRSTRSGRAM